MKDNRISEASWDLINSLRETNQAVASNLVAVQDLNLKFAQSIFLNGVEVLENQTESTRNLVQTLQQQGQRQQNAFEKLAYATPDIYADYFRTLFSFYRYIGDSSQKVMRQGLNYTQDTTRQIMETVANATGQEAGQAERNMH